MIVADREASDFEATPYFSLLRKDKEQVEELEHGKEEVEEMLE